MKATTGRRNKPRTRIHAVFGLLLLTLQTPSFCVEVPFSGRQLISDSVVDRFVGRDVFVASADLDADGDIDQDDFWFFELCLSLSGPGIIPPFQECIDSFDFDDDGDVDVVDYGVFQESFTGAF